MVISMMLRLFDGNRICSGLSPGINGSTSTAAID